MAITVFTNAFLIDCTGKEPMDGAAVVVEGERIKDVIRSGKVGPLKGRVETVNCKGKTLMPGLTDAHVHMCAVDANIPEQHRNSPPSLIAAKAMRRIEQCLMQGFTTVRDAGGADYGFREAVSSGLYPGPRLLVSGRPLSQTGGHADKRRRAEWIEPVQCCVGMAGIIADGADEVRKAAREQIRHDVDQIKIMASGGAMSPGDELDTTQYTVDEMKAAVEEANAVGKYVLAHAYSGAAIRNAVTAGVRCIEHGNLLDAAGAQAIKKAGAFLVPTMVTYEAIYREGKNYGIGDHQIQKINIARERSVDGLTHAYRAGCKIGSGSDLLGDMQSQRAVEFELKAQVMKPMEVLMSATQVNAQIFKMEKDIGTVEPGKYADLLLVKGNPLKELRLFQNQDNLLIIMKGGVAYKRTA
ncbi:MAG TPA: amidohydrolase family protein [Methylomirabilota bacterium]|nr:amidohydrolase family protein [Methylomirabilota bacterium]